LVRSRPSRCGSRAAAAVLGALAALALPEATAQTFSYGWVSAFDGNDVISSGYFAKRIDATFEDGSRGNGVIDSNVDVVLTQCYGGNWLANFNNVLAESEVGGSSFDPVRFTNATVLAGDVPDQQVSARYGADVTAQLKPGRTDAQVQNLVRAGTPVNKNDDPQIQGDPNRRVGGLSSTHVLVWASSPDPFDRAAIDRIAANFPEGGSTTVTVLAGDGTAAQGTAAVDGPATRTALDTALETIGALMDDGPDEQFKLIVLDHGGMTRMVDGVIVVPPADPGPPPTPGTTQFSLDFSGSWASGQDDLTTFPSPFADLVITEPIDPNVLQFFAELGGDPVPLPGASVTTQPLPDGTTQTQVTIPLGPLQMFFLNDSRDPIPFSIRADNSSDVPITFWRSAVSSGGIRREPAPDYERAVCVNETPGRCGDAAGYWRLEETSGTTLANRGYLGTGPSDVYVGQYATIPGPRPPPFPGLEAGNNAKDWNALGHAEAGSNAFAGPFTISSFVRPDALLGSVASVGKVASGNLSWQLWLGTDGRVGFDVSQDGALGVRSATVWSRSAIPTGQWSHVGATFDPGSSMNVFVDGVSQGQLNFGVPPAQLVDVELLRIGDTGFDGGMDETGMMRRVLTREEMAALYNVARGGGPRTAFGFPHAPLGQSSLGTSPNGGVLVYGSGSGGSDGVTISLTGQPAVVTQGFQVEVESPLEGLVGGVIGAVIGAKLGANPVLAGQLVVASAGTTQFVTASFTGLGETNVAVEVWNGETLAGSFTAPAGTVASMPATGMTQIGIADGSSWTLCTHFEDAVPITPSIGGAPLTGNRLRATAPTFSRAAITQVSNFDVALLGMPAVILRESVGPLPPRLPGDTDGDGTVTNDDVVFQLMRLGASAEPWLGGDFDGNNVIDLSDVRVVTGLAPGPSARASMGSPSPLAGTGPVSLALTSPTPNVFAGDSVTLDLDVADLGAAMTLGGLVIEVTYDPALFAFQSATFSGALGIADASLDHAIDPGAGMAGFAFDRPGVVSIYLVSLLDAAALAALQSGPFPLADLVFTAIAPGTGSFDLANAELVDGAQPPVALTATTQGTAVTAAAAPIPALRFGGALLLALALAAVALRLRAARARA
jgi:hypothetical protein